MPWQAHYKCIQHKTGFQARFLGSKSRNNAFALIEIRNSLDNKHLKCYSFGMKIYLATGNLNKKREVSELFPEHTIVIPKDEGIDFDPEETGSTFYENSLIKAKALWEIVRSPVLADDSGICADALNGAPGIYSSRYAAELTAEQKNAISHRGKASRLIKKIAEEILCDEGKNA